MAFTKSRKPGCCGTFNITYELSYPLRSEQTKAFEAAGFSVSMNYKNAGMLYAETDQIIAIGSFGTKNLQLKCKVPKCDEYSGPLESVLMSLSR